jgi:hypothetical protein
VTKCRSVAENKPRLLRTHLADCNSAACRGCEPCGDLHCRICDHIHLDRFGTCPSCLSEVRTNLATIGKLCGAVPAEAEHRGINSQAMFLLAPAADPEARSHLEDSVMAGRIPAEYLDYPRPGDRLHPDFIVGNWDMLVRGCLEHDPSSQPWTLASSIGYLDRQLTYLAAYDGLEFADLATELNDCARHLEQVLHDGDQIEHGAPCLTCKRKVTRTTDDAGVVSFYCERCKKNLTENEYRLAVRAAYTAHADRLTITDLADRIRVKPGTLRRWASARTIQTPGKEPIEYPPLLRSCGRDLKGRNLYRIAAAINIRDNGGDTRGTTRSEAS